jgi:hypothetical protein
MTEQTTKPMTAADHFRKAEYLLEAAANYPDQDARYTARARQHIAAAEFLLKLEELAWSKLNGPHVLRTAGFSGLVAERIVPPVECTA